MRKLFILTAVLMLAASAGCGCCDWCEGAARPLAGSRRALRLVLPMSDRPRHDARHADADARGLHGAAGRLIGRRRDHKEPDCSSRNYRGVPSG